MEKLPRERLFSKFQIQLLNKLGATVTELSQGRVVNVLSWTFLNRGENPVRDIL